MPRGRSFPSSPRVRGRQEGAGSGYRQGLVLPDVVPAASQLINKAFWPLIQPTISVSLGSLQQVVRDWFYSLFFLARGPSVGCLSPTTNEANDTQNRATGVSPA